MTDTELDARVTTLEENGGGSTQNGNKNEGNRSTFLKKNSVQF